MKVFVMVMVLSVGLLAQEAKAPTLEPIDLESIERVIALAKAESLAKTALEQSTEFKQYKALNAERTKLQNDRLMKIEKAYPGYTVDWTKRALVVKPGKG